MPWRSMKALAKSFELSSCAALRVGPKIFMPRSRKISTMPAASGASGPTTVSVTCSCCAKSANAAGSVMATFFIRASSAVPPLPGATSTICMRLDCASFQASACSRPPEPTTRIFMKASGQVIVSELPLQARQNQNTQVASRAMIAPPCPQVLLSLLLQRW